MSTPNPIEVAAIPTAIGALTAVQTFMADIGTDPLLVVAKLPGASQKLLGSLELLIPGLASSELGAAQTEVNTKIAGWLTTLKSKLPTA